MAFVWQRGDGDRLPLGPNRITYKVDGDAGQGRFSLLEYDILDGELTPDPARFAEIATGYGLRYV